MRKVDRSALVAHSARDMYALVNDVEAYPSFLPWCREAKIHNRTNEQLEASLRVVKSGIDRWFTTRNRNYPGTRIDLDLVDGPFEYLSGYWEFQDLDNGAASKVSFHLEFKFSNALLGVVLGPVFNHICDSLIDAFIVRADNVYGNS